MSCSDIHNYRDDEKTQREYRDALQYFLFNVWNKFPGDRQRRVLDIMPNVIDDIKELDLTPQEMQKLPFEFLRTYEEKYPS